MSQIVVLGMHRSGTSLLSSILRRMGVNMGTNFLNEDYWNPYGYWEDKDFLWINKGILENAGGSWRNPPSRDHITGGAKKFSKAIRETLDRKMRETNALNWGWKDPRTCLTIWEYHERLPDPKYIYIRRSPFNIYASLIKLHGGNHGDWMELHDKYKHSVNTFLEENDPPLLNVMYEDFIELTTLDRSLASVSSFVGVEELPVLEAMKLLNRKKTRVAK